jgi:hypothetical protein
MLEIENLIKSFKPNSELYFLIAKWFYKNLEFEKAIKFGNLSLIKSRIEKRTLISKFVDKLNWMKNNFENLNSYEF